MHDLEKEEVQVKLKTNKHPVCHSLRNLEWQDFKSCKTPGRSLISILHLMCQFWFDISIWIILKPLPKEGNHCLFR